MKKNFIPLIERETIITYNEAENIANVYTMNRKLSRKLSDLSQEYPSLVNLCVHTQLAPLNMSYQRKVSP